MSENRREKFARSRTEVELRTWKLWDVYEIFCYFRNAEFEKEDGRNRKRTGKGQVMVWRGLKRAKS